MKKVYAYNWWSFSPATIQSIEEGSFGIGSSLVPSADDWFISIDRSVSNAIKCHLEIGYDTYGTNLKVLQFVSRNQTHSNGRSFNQTISIAKRNALQSGQNQ